MKFKDILLESISLDTTITSIVADLGSPLSQMYNDIGNSAIDYFKRHETVSGAGTVTAARMSRWYQEFYYNKLQRHLFSLVKFAPKHANDLKKLLNARPESFKDLIEMELPEILYDLGKSMKNESLTNAAKNWLHFEETWIDLKRRLVDMEQKHQAEYGLVKQKADRTIKSHSGNITKTYKPSANARSNEPKVDPSDSKKMLGQQYSQIEAVVNDVLSNLPKHIASEIRQKIAKSDNKLVALQQELAKHQVQMESVVYSNIVSKNILTESIDYQQVKKIISTFIKFAKDQLELDSLPKIKLITNPEYSIKNSSFGGYRPDIKCIEVMIANRHIQDLARTLAHELVHFKQDLNNELHAESGKDGSEHENQANAEAAVIMRLWGKRHPELFGFKNI